MFHLYPRKFLFTIGITGIQYDMFGPFRTFGVHFCNSEHFLFIKIRFLLHYLLLVWKGTLLLSLSYCKRSTPTQEQDFERNDILRFL